MNWAAEKKLKILSTLYTLSPLGRASKKYLRYAFGKPIWEKPLQYGLQGLEKTMYAGEVAVHTTKEVGKGLFKMVAMPPLVLATSRLITLKRYLWDVPLTTLASSVRMAVGTVLSPVNAVKGMTESIKSVPSSISQIAGSIGKLDVMDTIFNTRDALANLLFPPVTRPLGPIVEPAYAVGKEAFMAEYQTVEKVRNDIPNVFMEGYHQVGNSVAAARATVDARWAASDAEKAKRAELREAQKEHWKKKVADERGEYYAEPAGAGGGKGGGGKGGGKK